MYRREQLKSMMSYDYGDLDWEEVEDIIEDFVKKLNNFLSQPEVYGRATVEIVRQVVEGGDITIKFRSRYEGPSCDAVTYTDSGKIEVKAAPNTNGKCIMDAVIHECVHARRPRP